MKRVRFTYRAYASYIRSKATKSKLPFVPQHSRSLSNLQSKLRIIKDTSDNFQH